MAISCALVLFLSNPRYLALANQNKAINSGENKVFFGLYEKIQIVLKIFLKKI
jgi:hypothetical protein